jgi:hypothetical protein
LGLSDNEALPRRLHDRLGHFFKGVDFENSFNLGEQTVQQPEVAPP